MTFPRFGTFLLQIWVTMLLIVIVFGGTACLLVSSFSPLIPISILAGLVGLAGSVLAYLGILGAKSDDPSDRTSGL
jgi:hypothetical protein